MKSSKKPNLTELLWKQASAVEELPVFTLWHYTREKYFKGIVGDHDEKGSLHFRFTKSDCFSDKTEGKVITNIYIESLLRLKNSGRIPLDFYQLIKGITVSDEHIFEFPIQSEKEGYDSYYCTRENCEAYIACFCYDEDSAYIWRYYSGAEAGCALKLSSKLFGNKSCNGFGNKFNSSLPYCGFNWCKVIYDDEEKVRIVTKIIEDAYSAYENSFCSPDSKAKDLIRYLSNELNPLRFRFKLDSFREEKEFRFIVYRPVEKPACVANSIPAVGMDQKDGRRLKYVVIDIENASDLLYEVMVGSQSARIIEQTIPRVEQYLKQSGFNCIVTKSENSVTSN